MPSSLTVLYDASVLYPAPLRDLLMQLALTDLYRARWTEQIHEEWIRNLLKNRPDLTRTQLNHTRQLMNRHVPDCLIKNYEELIPALTLPDPDDRHVLAAAIKGEVDVIVTMNLRDFPASVLTRYEMEAQHPDDFIIDLIDLDFYAVVEAVKACHARLKNPPKSVDEYLYILTKQQLAVSVSRLRKLWFQV
ncbi:PIN domain-containing protein [Euhalothece natronophila Z-M001]|uniref:PIN domain-containing protein n=1 Tax=Euhalothece natronophila Z-M001 TaxID=522448 RepID=A0A5B8NPS9_9CHRO|nr:PIN domain-containing protein [Euhalothece natronophila]QDZ41024.1 PIN domain-containing protein [Euhalothece natronophila Z-M001]